MKLTKKKIDAARYQGDGKSRDVRWDDEVPGFGVRVYPGGKKSFVLSYRNAGGRKRLYTIAPFGALTLDKARKKASKLLGGVVDGDDPVETRRAERRASTVAELCDDYLADHAEKHKKASSLRNDRSMIERIIKPKLGSLKVAAVTRADVARLKNGLSRTPHQANRVVALLSKMMNLAEQWGIRPDHSNPCRHVARFKETKRERYLSASELAYLADALAEAEGKADTMPPTVALIRLLLFTGARLGEILALRWEHVDFEHGCLRLPDSKTGAKLIHLNAPALSVLAAVKRHEGNPHVIAGQKRGAPLVNAEKPWRALRERATVMMWADNEATSALVARLERKLGRTPTYRECLAERGDLELPTGLADVRIHDLRHSFASAAAAAGLGLPMIGKLLGHREVATTGRYAHLADDPARQASELIAARIAGAMNRGNGKVVSIDRTG